jgi:hypothetical protein
MPFESGLLLAHWVTFCLTRCSVVSGIQPLRGAEWLLGTVPCAMYAAETSIEHDKYAITRLAAPL